MTIPILRLISNLWKPEPRRVPQRRHLMLAGINQRVFLNQWGTPEVRINLDHLEGSYQQGGVAFDPIPREDIFHSVWIYVKQDRICFFSQKRLVSHFKWSAFKDRKDQGMGSADFRSGRENRKPALMAHAIAMVA